MHAIRALWALCGTCAACSAQVGVFGDRAAWEAAANGPQVVEDLSGFAVDTEFRSVPRALAGGMTVSQLGVNLPQYRNFIDVPEFLNDDGNGTEFLSCFVDSKERLNPGIKVKIAFDPPVHAFGFETSYANEVEGVVVEAYSGTQLLGEATLTNDPDAFAGFVAGSLRITSVIFRPRVLFPSSIGEGFGLDNLRVVEAAYPCAGDFNADGFVDDADFVIFAAAYEQFTCGPSDVPPGCPADLTGDGVVDDSDFVIFAGAYDAFVCG